MRTGKSFDSIHVKHSIIDMITYIWCIILCLKHYNRQIKDFHGMATSRKSLKQARASNLSKFDRFCLENDHFWTVNWANTYFGLSLADSSWRTNTMHGPANQGPRIHSPPKVQSCHHSCIFDQKNIFG